jgi:SAM-dependent methyltransferase
LHKTKNDVNKYENILFANSTYDSLIWKLEKEILYREIQQLKVSKINYMDFACGTGRILSFLEKYTYSATGVDVSSEMLALAVSKVKNAFLLNCDLTKEDRLKNQKFELITAFRFFLNAQDQLRRQAMALLAGKLSSSGTLIFNIHGNTHSYYALPLLIKGKQNSKLKGMSYFEIKRLVNGTHLKIIKFYGIGFIPSSFYRFIKNKNLLLIIERFLSKLPFAKYFARDLIFVVRK